MFDSDKCSRGCLGVGALFGLLIAVLAYWNADFNMVVSLILGLIAFGVGYWVLTIMFCGEEGEGARARPVDAPPPAASPQRTQPSVAIAGLVETSAPAKKAAAMDAPATAPAEDGDFDHDGVDEGTNEGEKPATLKKARKGAADDLKKIKGVGPKMEGLLNSLGFFHFDQLASWSTQEIAWVDANLEGFKGRVSRDNWVDQAKALASGGETEFSKRVEDGDVY